MLDVKSCRRNQHKHVRRMDGAHGAEHGFGDDWKTKSDDLFDGHDDSNFVPVQLPICRCGRGGDSDGSAGRLEKK